MDVKADHIDLLSISGHKIYGPKGIGVLYVNRRTAPKVEAIIHGGVMNVACDQVLFRRIRLLA